MSENQAGNIGNEVNPTSGETANNKSTSCMAIIAAILIAVFLLTFRSCSTNLSNQSENMDRFGMLEFVDKPSASQQIFGNKITVESIITSDVSIGDVTVWVYLYDKNDVLIQKTYDKYSVRKDEKVKVELVLYAEDVDYYTISFIY